MKNVKIEKAPQFIGKTWRELLDEIEVDESFLFDEGHRATISTVIYRDFHVRGEKKFRTTLKNQPRGQVRVWRVK